MHDVEIFIKRRIVYYQAIVIFLIQFRFVNTRNRNRGTCCLAMVPTTDRFCVIIHPRHRVAVRIAENLQNLILTRKT